MANSEATPVPTPARPAEWRPTRRHPKPRRGAAIVAARAARVLAGRIPPPDAVRDEALGTLLDLKRHSENDPCRFAAAKLLPEYAKDEFFARAMADAQEAELRTALEMLREAGE